MIAMFLTRPHGALRQAQRDNRQSQRDRNTGVMVGGPQLGWGAPFDRAQDKQRLERSAF